MTVRETKPESLVSGRQARRRDIEKWKKKIREIYDCTLLTGDDPLVIWYNHVIDKTVAELTAADVARCIRQRLFVEKAYELLLAYLLHNPYEEDIYEGELLDKATEVDDALITKYKAIIVEIIDSAEKFINEHEWVCEEEKANIRNQLKNCIK